MNEFRSLAKRCVESGGYCTGDQEDAATSALWLQCHGMQGLQTLLDALNRPRSELLPIGSGPGVKHDEEDIMDAQHCSALICGNKAIEAGVCRAMDAGFRRINIRHCHEQSAIVAALATTATDEVAVVAHWRSAHDAFVVYKRPQQRLPSFHQLDDASTTAAANSDLFLECSTNADTVDQLVSNLFSAARRTRDLAPHADLQQAEDNATECGLNVDKQLWDQLLTMADGVLVEATARSRLGAGEQPPS